jgi:hypothetical protein
MQNELSKNNYIKNRAKSPISQLLEISHPKPINPKPSLKFLITSITCKSQIQKKSQLPSFSHTICDPTIHVCVCVSLSLSHALFHWGNTKSKFLFVCRSRVTQPSILYSREIDQQQSKSSFCSHTNLTEKKAIVGTRKALGGSFFNTRKSRIYKVKFPSEEIGGSFGFSLGILWSYHHHFIRRSISLLALHWATSSVGWLAGHYVG